MTTEILDLMARVLILKDLSPVERSNIATFAELDFVRSGKLIAKRGSSPEVVSFIIEGGARVCRASQDGKELTIALLGAGAHIGVSSLLAKAARTTDIISTARTTLLKFDAAPFQGYLQRSAHLSFLLLKSLATRLEATSLHLAENSLLALDQRLALRLLELAEVVEWQSKEQLLVRQRPSHQELAHLLGVSREAITRSLKQLENDGHIDILDNQVLLYSTPVER